MIHCIAGALAARFVECARAALGDNLVGVYLHGSAAMGCYNPDVSDVDFIVVVRDAMTDAERRAFMRSVVSLDAEAPGKGVEMSVVTARACSPFADPTPFELHWSRMHAAWYARDPEDYIQKMRGTDADLAAHFTVIRARGECLCGAPIGAVFAPVPSRAYADSIWDDVCGAEAAIAENPVYLILNLARVLAWMEDGAVLSKREGGEWALGRVPEYRSLVEAALSAYAGGDMAFDPARAREYARHMLGRVAQRRGEMD